MINCPTCSSENCQKLSVIFKQGTSETNSNYQVKVEKNPLANEFVDMSGSSRSMTAAAEEAAPPKNGAPVAVLFGATIFLLLAVVFFAIASGWFTYTLTTVFGTLAAINYFVVFPRNVRDRSSYGARYSEWLDSWHCNKCGGIFQKSL